jgi:16S rRNA C967 or C1407 C5-methylase (RsmB/RsmF family)/NOL1/NOP2/fmu family ribosome biogenesis protein
LQKKQLHFPEGFIESLRDVEGFNEAAFKAVHESGEQITSIRINPLKQFNLQSSNFNLQSIPWCEVGFYLSERPSFTMDPLFHGGAYYVQEPGSMFLWYALKQSVDNVNAQLKVLDVCAAPGGKSTLLASLFPNSLLISNEVIKSRAAILSENITKWGSENVIVTNNDPSSFSKLPGYADVIVVDAPCSGSGLFRKDPSAMEEWSVDNVMMCSKRQQRILEDVIPALKENGILVYSTCSYSAEEDEAIMQWLLNEKKLQPIRLNIPEEWNIVETKTDNAFGYRFYPDKIRSEGFFLTVFKNTTATDETFAFGSLPKPSKTDMEIINKWIKDSEVHTIFKQGENFHVIDKSFKHDLAFLQKNLYIKKGGINIGTIKGKDFIPAHDLAVSTVLNENALKIADVELPAALQFLKKQNIDHEFTATGWTLMRYAGVNLGWLKVLPNRVNNYYPVEWRILKD